MEAEAGAEAGQGAHTRALYDRLLAPVARQVDAELAQEANSLPAELREMYDYAVGGGMRFRPCLMYLACLACGADTVCSVEEDGYSLIRLASAVELLHKASLVHDDLIDEDTLRRGRPSFHAVFGSERAVVMGDLLVAMAYAAVGRLRPLLPLATYDAIQSRFNKAHLDLCSGELLELAAASSEPIAALGLTLDYVERVIEGKTASLMEQSLAMGSVMAGAPASCVDALARYGRCMGFVFQTVNDINNLTGFDQIVKGRSMTDLALGRVGYPSFGFAAAADDAAVGRETPRQLRRSDCPASAPGCSNRALYDWLGEVIHGYAEQARHALRALPKSGARDALDSIGREMFETWFWKPESCADRLGGMCDEQPSSID